MDGDNWVRLKNFSSVSEAEMMREVLQKEGIKCAVQRGDLNAAAEFMSATGDADLFCFQNDFQKAESILKAFIDLKE